MLVILAATPTAAEEAETALRELGATTIDWSKPGLDRVLVWGGPFGDGEAVGVVARLRAAGWPASDRPDGGGHLTAWQAHTAPVVIDDRLWICFPWSDVPRTGGVVVEIDPGLAFGTGAHPSTRLLLHELARRLAGGETVLDVGCGSGVLAIAAVRLGAASAVGVDLAPAAVEATAANATRNGAGSLVRASTTALEDLDGVYDVVLANIGCETLRLLGSDLARLLAPGGWLAVSGISPAQVSSVAAALPGLALVDSPGLDDWAALVAERT